MHGRVGRAVEANAGAGSRGASIRALRRGLLVVGLLVLGLCSAPARAQTVPSTSSSTTSTTSSLTPLRSPNGDITLVPNSQGIERRLRNYPSTLPWWISYKDCIERDSFTFTFGANVSGYNLEIWVGTENCATNRNNLTTIGQCWMVGKKNMTDTTVEIEVPVRNVLARRTGVDVLPGDLGEEVCGNSTDSNGEAISWYFIVVKGNQGAEYITWSGSPNGSGIDVVGPAPPRSIQVGVGENQLSIKMYDPPKDQTRKRYEAFCVPKGTPTVPGLDAGGASSSTNEDVASLLDGGLSLDASTSSLVDAGGSDTSAAPAACFTDLLRVGARPPTNDSYSCGTITSFSDTLLTSRLQNNQVYAVAVAGQDDLGNAGVVSEIQCGTPIPLDDFYELYVAQGGQGGGGFCSFSPGRRTSIAGSAALVGLLLAGLGWRRSRGRA